MTKYQAVVFDLDGTLLDTLTDLWNAVNVACRSRGYPTRTRLQVRRDLGNGLQRLLKLSLPKDVEENQFRSLFQAFRQYYLTHCNEATHPYGGSQNCWRSSRRRASRRPLFPTRPIRRYRNCGTGIFPKP